MESEGPNSPGAGASNNSFGTVAWGNPGSIVASDVMSSECKPSSGVHTSEYLVASQFGFAIPAGATIDGIEAEIQRKNTVAGKTVDARVRLVKAGVIQATDKASATGWPDADAYEAYGGAADLWGGAWTADDINDAGFGLALAATVDNDFGFIEAHVNHVRITVHYTEAAAPAGSPPRQRQSASRAGTKLDPPPTVFNAGGGSLI